MTKTKTIVIGILLLTLLTFGLVALAGRIRERRSFR